MKILTRLLLIWAGAALVMYGHEISTHKKIGDAAVVYLQAVYANANSPRPLLLSTVTALQNQLQIGAEHEDDTFGPSLGGYNPFGRYIFHFTPALNNSFYSPVPFGVSADSCSSVDWG